MSNWSKNGNHKHKAWIVLLSILTPVLLVGVGFSAYFIRNEAEASAHINVDAEDFAEGNQSISISFTGDVTYFSSAYVDASHTTSTTAALTAEVTFTGFNNVSSASFLFTLSEPSTANIIANITGKPSVSLSGVNCDVSDNNTSTAHTLGNVMTFSTSSDNLPSSFAATVSYTLSSANNLSDATLTLKVAKQ